MLKLTDIPRQQPEQHLEEINGEAIVFELTSARTYFMNPTASAVWKLCDGVRSVQAIIDILAEAYPESAAEIATDVTKVVDELALDGALAVEASSTAENG